MSTTDVQPSFWSDWIHRFQSNANRYITPDDKKVQEFCSGLSKPCCVGKVGKAVVAWEYVNDKIAYRLSEEWKTPRETIADGTGDCEDMDFLLGSIVPKVGITSFNIAVGYLHHQDRQAEAHSWIVVDGTVMDPTGSPSEIVGHSYETKQSIPVEINER